MILALFVYNRCESVSPAVVSIWLIRNVYRKMPCKINYPIITGIACNISLNRVSHVMPARPVVVFKLPVPRYLCTPCNFIGLDRCGHIKGAEGISFRDRIDLDVTAGNLLIGICGCLRR